jgi:hypothetical protein
MDARRERPATQHAQAEASIPVDEDAGTDEHPLLFRQCVNELMDVLIAINDQRREVVRLRESTRDILEGLRIA